MVKTFARVALAATLFALATAVPLMASAAPADLNDPAYWETYFPNTSHCIKHETPSDTPHGYETPEPDAGVILNPIDPSWGAFWSGLVIKAGTERTIVELPQPGVLYLSPDGKAVSHFIVCKGSESSPSTTEPPTTTTTTTTVPPTTSTTTTTTPATTTTTVVTTTTAPPTTTTTAPPVTTTTVPEQVDVEVDIACDPERDPYEPMYTNWTVPPSLIGAFEPQFTFVIYLDNELAGAIELATIPTPGFHDNWFEKITEPLDALVRVEVVKDGELYKVYEEDCSRPNTTTTEPPPTTETPDCDDPEYAAANPDKCLPHTGPGDIRGTNLGLMDLTPIGTIIIAAGTAMTIYADRKAKRNEI